MALIDDCAVNLPPEFGSYRGPALLLTSDQSRVCTPAGLEAVRHQLGDHLSVLVLDDTSHNPLWDAYDRTAQEISKFLRREISSIHETAIQ
jgi:pimeloyl-ACP methyl ester carboxylesterase